jgi:chaperonin cofactor prefoldin
MQIRNKEAEKKRAFLTVEELERLPEFTNTYRSVGKAFILESRDTLLKEQQTKADDSDSAIATLQVCILTPVNGQWFQSSGSAFCPNPNFNVL